MIFSWVKLRLNDTKAMNHNLTTVNKQGAEKTAKKGAHKENEHPEITLELRKKRRNM